MATFVKFGFHDVVEKISLGGSFLKRFDDDKLKELSSAERIVLAFEELGPTFVKMGQLLATRPDLVPAEYSHEFKRLHDQVSPLEFSQIEAVMNNQYGDYREFFEFVDSQPLASASIAQVHVARLKDGHEVVIKVQRPGIKLVIKNDIDVLYMLADLLHNAVEEVRIFNPRGIVDELFRTLTLETNFLVEANNIKKFQKYFEADVNVKIPNVYLDLSGESILVLEKLEGIPLSKLKKEDYPELSRHELVRKGIRAYFDMVFKYGFFHGDLHSGNLFILPNGAIGLIDFGVVGRLIDRAKRAIAAMFVSLFNEDYDRLALEYIDLAPYNEKTHIEEFARELRSLLGPYFGLTMKNVNLGKLLMDSTSLAAKYHVSLPPDLILFFKSIVTVEGMGRQLVDDFDLLPYTMEFSRDLLQMQLDPQKLLSDLGGFTRDSYRLLESTPRQIHQLLRKLNNPDLAVKFELKNLKSLQKSVEASGHLVFLGLVIASLILSASLMPEGLGSNSVLRIAFYSLAFLLSFYAFVEYIRRK